MTIDPDVASIARHFGIDAALIQAVVQAEGDILRAVQCSVPTVTTRAQAIEITCRSAVHAMSDFIRDGDLTSDPLVVDIPTQFVHFFAARWAPPGVKNDPTALNQFWPSNVLRLWVNKP